MGLSLYLQLGSNADVDPPLGFSILDHNVAVTQVTQDIIIQAEKNFIYYNARFDTALNDGTLTQDTYDDIIGNQDSNRQVFEIETNLIIDKQLLIDLVLEHQIPNVDTGAGTGPEIIEDVIAEGYVFVKQI